MPEYKHARNPVCPTDTSITPILIVEIAQLWSQIGEKQFNKKNTYNYIKSEYWITHTFVPKCWKDCDVFPLKIPDSCFYFSNSHTIPTLHANQKGGHFLTLLIATSLDGGRGATLVLATPISAPALRCTPQCVLPTSSNHLQQHPPAFIFAWQFQTTQQNFTLFKIYILQ